MLGDEFGLEADDGVWIGDDGLGVVLGFVVGASGVAGDDEGSFSGAGPVGGAFGGDAAIGDEAFGVADLAGEGLADDEVGVVGGEVELLIGGEEGLLVDAAGLAAVESDEHGDGGVEGLGHDDVVELGVVEAEHIEVEGDADAGEDVLEDVVDVVAADVEEVDVAAGDGGISALPGELLEVAEMEGLQSFGVVCEGVAGAGLGGGGVGLEDVMGGDGRRRGGGDGGLVAGGEGGGIVDGGEGERHGGEGFAEGGLGHGGASWRCFVAGPLRCRACKPTNRKGRDEWGTTSNPPTKLLSTGRERLL